MKVFRSGRRSREGREERVVVWMAWVESVDPHGNLACIAATLHDPGNFVVTGLRNLVAH